MGTAAQIATGVAVLAMAGFSSIQAAQEPPEDVPAEHFVSLRMQGACDDKNQRLWLVNAHTFKTVAITVRWRADGGKDLTQEFFPGPGSEREIGCAAEAQVVRAAFAAF